MRICNFTSDDSFGRAGPDTMSNSWEGDPDNKRPLDLRYDSLTRDYDGCGASHAQRASLTPKLMAFRGGLLRELAGNRWGPEVYTNVQHAR